MLLGIVFGFALAILMRRSMQKNIMLMPIQSGRCMPSAMWWLKLLPGFGLDGVPFTWDNRQQGNANVKAILDQGLVYDSFLGLFYYASVKNASLVESYYCLY